MDDEYLIQHLKKLMETLNPGQKGFAYVATKGYFKFGMFDNAGRVISDNIISKQIAIYLIIGVYVPEVKKKRLKRRRTK